MGVTFSKKWRYLFISPPLLTAFFSYIPTPLEVVPLVELLVSGGAEAGPAGSGTEPRPPELPEFLDKRICCCRQRLLFSGFISKRQCHDRVSGWGQGARAQGVPTADGLPPNRSYFISR